ncbi:PREDICTED: SH3 domain-binding protein 5-like [Lepidothrix coronata]|uniref:SH3 domain-binding protein 5 n=1 Tax=Lepidothrix coronata TaxID=321398 RepID=A0A6J0JAX7_9PASS|nr:PREDICTED: SH3 domain-binding protein 5-like [Lepidothrix coronata]
MAALPLPLGERRGSGGGAGALPGLPVPNQCPQSVTGAIPTPSQAARSAYRRILSESARKLNSQGSQLGNCIERARPYYEARRRAKEVPGKSMEKGREGPGKGEFRVSRSLSSTPGTPSWELLSQGGTKSWENSLENPWKRGSDSAGLQVNEAEEERVRSEREHQRVTRLCQEAEAEVQALQKSLKRVILRSKPYFELKAQFNQILEEHKSKVTALESRVSQAKTRYSVALRNLEQISEQIHARRLQRLLQRRESPVGAESSPRHPSPESRGADLGAECPAGDSLSVLSLQTVASDLQKFDSVEHLVGISDAASLGSDEPGERERRRSLRHHRSVSL